MSKMNLYLEPEALAIIKDSIKIAADLRHAKYPQYAGHWDGPEWKIGRALRDLKTKMGLVCQKDEYILVKADEVIPHGPHAGEMGFTFYSLKSGYDTAILAKDFRFVEGVASWA